MSNLLNLDHGAQRVGDRAPFGNHGLPWLNQGAQLGALIRWES
jgi:hypothetical protein